MEKVTRYKASDGQLFVDEYTCLVHERNIVAMEELENLYHNVLDDIGCSGIDFARFVLDNKEEIVKILIENMKS